MLAQQDKYTNGAPAPSDVFPVWKAIDASGAGLTDGSEYAALPINDGWEAFSQAVMHYASGVQLQNIPTGSIGVPSGTTDSVGLSQMLEALQRSIGNSPGNYTLWGNEDGPNVTKDRVILLGEQGVLVAVYPGLDAANWVGSAGTDNQDRFDEGGKFYRSSDSGGATPDIAGPYIQLPAQPAPTFLKQYSEGSGDFTITGTGWTTVRAVAVPYQTVDGAWRIKFNLVGTVSALSSIDLTFSGILSKNIAGATQAVNARSTGSAPVLSHILANTNIFVIQQDSTHSDFLVSGDIELNAMPSFADDFTYKWGIRY